MILWELRCRFLYIIVSREITARSSVWFFLAHVLSQIKVLSNLGFVLELFLST